MRSITDKIGALNATGQAAAVLRHSVIPFNRTPTASYFAGCFSGARGGGVGCGVWCGGGCLRQPGSRRRKQQACCSARPALLLPHAYLSLTLPPPDPHPRSAANGSCCAMVDTQRDFCKLQITLAFSRDAPGLAEFFRAEFLGFGAEGALLGWLGWV